MLHTRREFITGSLALIAFPFVKNFITDASAQKIDKGQVDKYFEQLKEMAEKQQRMLEQQLEELISTELVEIQKSGIKVDILNDKSGIVEFPSLNNTTVLAKKLENRSLVLAALRQIKNSLSRYDSIKEVLNGYLQKIYLVESAILVNSSTKSVIFETLAGYANPPGKSIILSTRQMAAFEGVKPVYESAFDHEFAHLIARDVNQHDWITKIYGNNFPDKIYFPAKTKFSDDKRPLGFARAYGTHNYNEDIATVAELLYGHYTIPPGMKEVDYLNDIRNDVILQRKLREVIRIISSKLGKTPAQLETHLKMSKVLLSDSKK